MEKTTEEIIEALRNCATNTCCKTLNCPYDSNNHQCYNQLMLDAAKILEQTLLPVHWNKEYRGGVEYTAVCSNCGYGTYWSDAQYYDYCPGCGCKIEYNEEY